MDLQIPINVHKILDVLNAAGFEAYAVGGCVRDSLLDAHRTTGISLPQLPPDR